MYNNLTNKVLFSSYYLLKFATHAYRDIYFVPISIHRRIFSYLCNPSTTFIYGTKEEDKIPLLADHSDCRYPMDRRRPTEIMVGNGNRSTKDRKIRSGSGHVRTRNPCHQQRQTRTNTPTNRIYAFIRLQKQDTPMGSMGTDKGRNKGKGRTLH